MTEPTEKVYLKKFYMAIGMVARVREVYVKNLDLGEWALPFPCRSSATPSRVLGIGYREWVWRCCE